MNAPTDLPGRLTASMASATSPLIDRLGRRITYLRLSVTDRCDFRCTYCMSEKMQFLPHEALMSLDECLRLVATFVDLGVTKVRITGGEPLVRRNVIWLLRELGRLPGLHDLVLTTNGSQLARYAHELKDAGVRRLNVSLDTLNPLRFAQITRTGSLEQVLAGLQAARQAGFTRTKINTVMMRGINDHELVHLAEFAIALGMDIAFIEEMPLGAVGGRNTRYISSDEALEHLQSRFRLSPSMASTGGPAAYWNVEGSRSRIGFIAPHSHNFCDSCNRVRVTAQGDLYPCLGHDDKIALLPALRDDASGDAALRDAIRQGLGIKPERHDFNAQHSAPKVMRFMSMTGG